MMCGGLKSFLLFFLLLSGGLFYSQSQSELLKNFTAQSLVPGAVADNKVSVRPKEWPITIERIADKISKITLMRAGVLEEVYQPDVPAYTSYFYAGDTRLCFINGLFVYYKLKSNEFEILYVLGTNGDNIKSVDVAKLRSSLTDYFATMSYEQRSAKDNLKDDLAAAKEKEKLANSLKGKNIKSLEVVWLTKESETGMQSKIQFGVKATDINGKVFATDNLGGKTLWDDFEVSAKGAVYGDEYLTVDTDISKIPNDIVTVTVKDKYQPNVSASNNIKLAYNTAVTLSYPGKHGCPPLISGTGTSGGRAPNAELNVCNSKDKNFVIIEVKIGGISLHKVKLKKDVPLYIDVTGGGGCSGRSEKTSQGGKGGNGGDGGDVTINKDPSVSGETINVYNSGGKGGKGGKGSLVDGPAGTSGQSGQINYNTKSIQFNF